MGEHSICIFNSGIVHTQGRVIDLRRTLVNSYCARMNGKFYMWETNECNPLWLRTDKRLLKKEPLVILNSIKYFFLSWFQVTLTILMYLERHIPAAYHTGFNSSTFFFTFLYSVK